jgi:hypothetical protein
VQRTPAIASEDLGDAGTTGVRGLHRLLPRASRVDGRLTDEAAGGTRVGASDRPAVVILSALSAPGR